MTIEEINNEIALLEPAEVNTRNVQVLASLYAIRDNLGTVPGVSFKSSTEFGKSIKDLDISGVLSVMDELMEATYVYNKPLYNATMRKLRGQE